LREDSETNIENSRVDGTIQPCLNASNVSIGILSALSLKKETTMHWSEKQINLTAQTKSIGLRKSVQEMGARIQNVEKKNQENNTEQMKTATGNYGDRRTVWKESELQNEDYTM